jgi:hypothetical protein
LGTRRQLARDAEGVQIPARRLDVVLDLAQTERVIGALV